MVRIQGKIVTPAEPGGTASLIRPVEGAVGPEEQYCELVVQDNGIGFDEKYLDRIFAVFQRLHGRQEYEGTGIGLAVCRRIVDRHGGKITAQSKPGEGATFIVQLPVHQLKQTHRVA
jgi:light-regulated signal transduction histidine kinase (bacteriophytochrome)